MPQNEANMAPKSNPEDPILPNSGGPEIYLTRLWKNKKDRQTVKIRGPFLEPFLVNIYANNEAKQR